MKVVQRDVGGDSGPSITILPKSPFSASLSPRTPWKGRKKSTMTARYTNAIKLVVGSLLGAAMMMMIDMNESIEKQLLDSLPTGNINSKRPNLRWESKLPEIALSNLYYNHMKEDPRLSHSLIQQAAFLERKDFLPAVFGRERRYNTEQREYAAVVLSDHWAFLHVWINGDRTVVKVAEDQLEEFQQAKDAHAIKHRKWFALVQDPIHHFLEGFAKTEMKLVEDALEKGHDDLASKIVSSWENEHLSYDQRVVQFLERMRNYSLKKATAELAPLMHALPQSNFLLNDVGLINPNLSMVGDVSEWKAMMELTGFTGDVEETMLDPVSTLQAKHFPSNTGLLSQQTLLQLCDFLAMDYFLLRYDPPTVCMRSNGPLDFSKGVVRSR